MMKLIVLSLFLLLGSSANAGLSGLRELVETCNPRAQTAYWLALGDPLEQYSCLISLRIITNESLPSEHRIAHLKEFIDRINNRIRSVSLFRIQLQELKIHAEEFDLSSSVQSLPDCLKGQTCFWPN